MPKCDCGICPKCDSGICPKCDCRICPKCDCGIPAFWCPSRSLASPLTCPLPADPVGPLPAGLPPPPLPLQGVLSVKLIRCFNLKEGDEVDLNTYVRFLLSDEEKDEVQGEWGKGGRGAMWTQVRRIR